MWYNKVCKRWDYTDEEKSLMVLCPYESSVPCRHCARMVYGGCRGRGKYSDGEILEFREKWMVYERMVLVVNTEGGDVRDVGVPEVK